MEIIQLFKSLLSRFIFLLHGVVSAYLIVQNNEEPRYWACTIPVFLLIFEAAYTLIVRKGQEFTYFWPSGLLYILTMIPIIWAIELELLDERIEEENRVPVPLFILPVPTATLNGSKAPPVTPKPLSINISNEVIGKKVGELGIIIGLITGRWLMPRGSMTRDQLSALLLGYVGNAADILELFETFEEDDVKTSRSLTLAVIAIYTWAILQFTLVTTATLKDKKDLEEDLEKQIQPPKKNQIAPTRKISGTEIHRDKHVQKKYIEDVRTRKVSVENREHRGRGRKISTTKSPTESKHKAINSESSVQMNERTRRRELHGEVFQILVTLMMQDGPFLVLRLYLIIQYNVVSEMHIFFTCKNAIVSVLLVYRLLILTCRGEDIETDLYREEAAAKLHNVQLAIMATHIEEETHNIRVQ
eukprot:TCONS_00051929-protein